MNERPELRTIIEILSEFRKLDPEMQMQIAPVFLEVAISDEPVPMADLMKRTGLAQPSVSRESWRSGR